MDGYQFTAALFQSLVGLAWPAVVGAIAWSYKENILSMLHRVTGTVKGFGLEFSLEAAEKNAKSVERDARQEARPAEGPAAPPEPSANVGAPPELSVVEASKPLAEEPIGWSLQELAEFVPAAVFKETMHKLMRALWELIVFTGLKYDGDRSPVDYAIFLLDNEVISERTAKLVAQLTAIERRARIDKPTPDQADRFMMLADAVQTALLKAKKSGGWKNRPPDVPKRS